ncbi:MAG: hypothetical protein P8174_07045 [Gemmatimonadota bacterium]|jgi:hypothetical protein
MRIPRQLAVALVPLLAVACDSMNEPSESLLGVPSLNFCEDELDYGRMTGGGVVRVVGYADALPEPVEVKVTHGFTLHCDVRLSNNLEINWGGNQWHLEKESLENISCIDDPTVSPEPPKAPFDTFIADAWGSLRLGDGPSVAGAYISFELQDSGEPGGKNDRASIAIWAPGADPAVDAPVLSVPFDFIVNGNIQAHYDQPHGSNWNK